NSALPDTRLIISKIVKNLWEQKDLTSFSMAVSIIVSLGKEASGCDEMQLDSISEAVTRILSDSDEEQITEQLKLLHPKIIDQEDLCDHNWFYSMLEILTASDLTKPSVIRFALEVLKLGWLDPILADEDYIADAGEHHELLVRLKSVDELKVEAAHCLKKWYKQFFSRENNSQLLHMAYENFQQRDSDTPFVSHCHDGFSSSLEYHIANPFLQNAWTDEPEGIPNVERMLAHHPAFPRLISGKGNHRPVIIAGEPSWGGTLIEEKAEALFQRAFEDAPQLKHLLKDINKYETKKNQCRNEPTASEKFIYLEKQSVVNETREICKQVIQLAFCHYLYRLTHSKGGCLTYCWAKASIFGYNEEDSYGAHDPSSPEELYAMMSDIVSSELLDSLQDDYLRQALNASNALVLKSSELTTIAEEFLNSVNLNSMATDLEVDQE
ncbi:hypothetical protein, partial [Endozoicomonas sp. SESOKO3]|uniref:hypothetical protein n=1 Tax=Endozoicomonas sp. SESOKO3 TaxID=2828744 RepID=UPI0021479E10